MMKERERLKVRVWKEEKWMDGKGKDVGEGKDEGKEMMEKERMKENGKDE